MQNCLRTGWAVFVVALALIASTLFASGAAPDAQAQAQQTADQVNEALGIGINLGNALEAPREGDWGLTLQADYFQTIAEQGFEHVRVPIRFTGYADQSPPFLIPESDPTVTNAASIWDRIDWVLAQAEANGLYVILDLHHYGELFEDPVGERDRFLSMWDQIATRYADQPDTVLFELLNEPHEAFNDNPQLWNDLFADALSVVRTSNPDRIVLVGPTNWNAIGALGDLVLPNDPNLIVTVHFYSPFSFTHQGATWLDEIPPTPVSFDADTIGLGAGHGNWSWQTEIQPSESGLLVTYENQFAGLNFGLPRLIDPVSVQVELAGDAELTVRCFDGSTSDGLTTGAITSTDAGSTFTIDMQACTSQTRSIAFALASTTADTLEFRSAQVCDVAGMCQRLIETGSQKIETAMDLAQQWGEANGRPINVGEFGAYSAEGVADLGERAEWTALVRSAGRERGFSMSYWEFGSGFGAFDPQSETWIEPLLTALAPEGVGLERGNVNCDNTLSIADAVFIAQLIVGNRTAVTSCPIDSQAEIYGPAADADRNGIVSIADAVLVARCTVGIPNDVCPAA